MEATGKEEDKKEELLGSPPSDAALEKLLGECERKRDEYLAGWQRARADFANYKRDELTRLEQVSRYASEELIRNCIQVLDSFELGIAALEKQGPVEKGIYMIRAQLEDVLKRRGLERVRITIGEKVNLSIAEVIGEVISDKAPGTVVEEIEAGYALYDKILRPVRVKISKGQSTDDNK